MKFPRVSVRLAFVACAVCGALFSENRAEGQEEIGPLIQADRQWSVKTGQGTVKLDARLIGLKQGAVEFADKQGRKQAFPLSDLEPEDRRAALVQRVGSGVAVIATKTCSASLRHSAAGSSSTPAG